MPCRRSWRSVTGPLSVAQQRRRDRDMWYWASPPAPGKKLISVPAPLAPSIKDMAKAKELHEMRERQLGASTHSLHSASSLAFRN
eukprot:7607963-Karenia_brevis.AAC.1